MKKLIIFLTLLLIAFPAYGAGTLFEFYQGNIPTVSERAAEFGYLFENPYTGTYEQNVFLLDYLQSEPEMNIGTAIPAVIATFETSLANKITSSQTTMTLVSGDTGDSTTLNGTYGFVIDEGTASEEFVIADCVDTACTDMSRGISTVTGTSSVTALQKSHRRGASVKITNHPVLLTIIRILNGQGTLPSLLTYDGLSIGAGDSGDTLIDKDYADALVASGVATATEAVFGGGTLSTQLEMASSSYSVEDPRLLHSRYATSSPDVRGLYIPVTENDGYLNQGFIDLSEDFTFTGNNTMASTTFNASTTWDILPEYDSDPIGDDEAVRKSYVDQYQPIAGIAPDFTYTQTDASSYTATSSISTVRRARMATFSMTLMADMQTGAGTTAIKTWQIWIDLINQKVVYKNLYSNTAQDETSCSLFTSGDLTQAQYLYSADASMTPTAFSITDDATAYLNAVISDDDSIDFGYTLNGTGDTNDACIITSAILYW